ncbi:hypothetical protein chiPu_0027881 [Chiloscyllium punctatum]|uniref:Uncharacterized protein n=1 Tax=Chiloscyllium punctatum TaxID=137246 RepID=A0A401TM80_CHIPU|nr:hypothetical protein [Chiloscyllium punctatum]
MCLGTRLAYPVRDESRDDTRQRQRALTKVNGTSPSVIKEFMYTNQVSLQGVGDTRRIDMCVPGGSADIGSPNYTLGCHE